MTGFLFCYVYRFAALKENQNDIEHILIKSFVAGYIIYFFAKMIPHSKIADKIYPILITIVAIVIAYLLAKFLISNKAIKIFDFLRIGETGNNYLWDDLRDPDYGIIATVTYPDKVFEGYIHEREAFTNSPHLVLCLYKVYDQNGNIYEDYSNDPSILIVLDSGNAESVKLDYANESVIAKDASRYLVK